MSSGSGAEVRTARAGRTLLLGPSSFVHAHARPRLGPRPSLRPAACAPAVGAGPSHHRPCPPCAFCRCRHSPPPRQGMIRRAWLLFAGLGLVLLRCSPVRAFQDDFPPNQQWECLGCPGDDAAKQRIYGFIRRAIYTESREVYLNFDHSWMERVLKTGIKVQVHYLLRDKMSTTELAREENPPERSKDERFQFVFSPSPDSAATGLSLQEAEIIDTFLMRNPCWMPLHDPPVRLPAPGGGGNNTTSPSISVAGSQVFGGVDYAGSAILAKLPAHGFYSTCQLFSYMTTKQNPPECPSKDKEGIMGGQGEVLVNWLGNIGWANALHPLIEHLVGAMHNGQILLTPRAWDNGAAKPVTVVVPGQGEVEASGPWSAWADPSECPKETFAWNPWNCFFISLSKCNNPELHNVKFQEHPKPDPSPPSEYMVELEKWKGKREAFGDAPHLGNEWEYARMISFAQRPNMATRARLRLALRNLIVLHASSYGPAAPTPGHAPLHHHPHHHQHAGHQVRMEPCLGMHVRHGDSMNDERGGKLDRSLQAHVTCAQDLADHMGLKNIYLATDDNKLFTEAPAKFPQFGWFGQYRELKNFTGGSFGYHSERSMQQEIANLLADQILMSRCAALVGTWNPGGFMKLLLQQSCSRSDIGKCPPSRELKKCQGK